ncbi:hypothetical protein M0805_004424 [Coniferiporia weirii]|nr:hypothetical protein M0805_004424 [Coniferiporia weirii]
MGDFAGRFLNELKSYTLVALPTFVIYILESSASLKLLHAVQQTPHPEPELSPDGVNAAEAAATSKAIKRAARRGRFGSLAITLILLAFAIAGQFVKTDETIDEDLMHRTLYLTDLFVVPDSYYAAALFLPSVFLIARTFKLLSGTTSKILFRDPKGAPFVIIGKGEGTVPRLPLFAAVISTLFSIGAVLACNSFCVSVLYAAVLNLLISNNVSIKIVTFKQHFILSLMMLFSSVILFGMHYSELQRGTPPQPSGSSTTAAVNWSALLISSMWSVASFNFISFCYRIDHSLARPGELLVGPPSVEGVIRGASNQVRGTRIPYELPSIGDKSTASSAPYAKPYFYASLAGWLAANALLAAMTTAGYVIGKPELTGMYVMYLSMPLMALAVAALAVVRGDFEKLWEYKEDWGRNPAEDAVDSTATGDVDLETKQSTPFASVDEKVDLIA